MSDRELLEFAAKAAGINIGGWAEDVEAYYVHPSSPIFLWNPLNNDGDALRLASKLDIDILFYRKHVDACDNTRNNNVSRGDFTSYKNKNQALRRAIVHRAAEIGGHYD